ncbi:MAG: AzlD domain-containing protein [Kiritimatiellae bacterium]|nr:AzlD domain-containing protein [Kiritimatiellia bacterium]
MTEADLFAVVVLVAAANFAMRSAPLVLLRKPLESPRLVAFVGRLPYAILAAMVVPDAFSATGSAAPSCAGLAVALALSLCGKSLPLVAAAATLAAFAVS